MTRPRAPRGSSTGPSASPRATTPIATDQLGARDIRFEADLDLVVDGTRAHVTGRGADLVVEAAEPARLLQTVRRTAGSSSRRDLAGVADRLASHGASVHLHGPRGRILTIGAAADARSVALLTGTRHVAPASGLALLTMARTMVPARWPRLALLAGAVAAGAIVGAGWVRRRMRSH